MKFVDRLPISEDIAAFRNCDHKVVASDLKHLPVLEGNNSAGPGSEQRQGCVGDGSVLVGRVRGRHPEPGPAKVGPPIRGRATERYSS